MHAKLCLGSHVQNVNWVLFAILLVWVFCGLVLGQESGNPTVTVTVSPVEDEVPMGTKVTLRATTNVADPTYSWNRACNGVNPWLHNVLWVVSQIDDCYGLPGDQTYRVFVNPGVTEPSLYGDKVVKFKPPDKATSTIDNPRTPDGDPPPGGSSRTDQIIKTKLTWNNKQLGPCAEVCYQENVSTTMSIRLFEKMCNLQVKDRPANCVKTVRGNSRRPDETTMNFDSPNLHDRVWQTCPYDLFVMLQDYPVGTVIATRKHKYKFYGRGCYAWAFETQMNQKYVVEEAKDSAGFPVPLAGSNPPKNTKIAQWVIESQTP